MEKFKDILAYFILWAAGTGLLMCIPTEEDYALYTRFIYSLAAECIIFGSMYLIIWALVRVADHR